MSNRFGVAIGAVAAVALLATAGCTSTQAQLSDRPDTPFKLATFDAAGQTRVGLVLGERVYDIQQASAHLSEAAGAPAAELPGEMKALIEAYDTAAPRLYQIANYFADKAEESHPFAFDAAGISLQAPIKYPWNLLAAAANYQLHSEEMAGRVAGGSEGLTARIDPDKDPPTFFAKSARSGILDPGKAYRMPPGRDQIDWEVELAIVIGRPATRVTLENAHDYVFGYTIMYDVSDRGGTERTRSFGADWFSSKSRDHAAPMGPYIVPKEFLPNHANLRISTRVNGVVKQDGNTRDLIHDEAHMLQYLTSILTLWPGDVVATGTPDGVGAGRDPQEFLKPGDVVEMEIEGIGILRTPIEGPAASTN